MTRTTLLAVVLATALNGCGRPGSSAPSPSVDQNRWSVTVDSYHQSQTTSTLRVSVDTPVEARITFHEPDSVLSQSFLHPGSHSFEVRKRLKPAEKPGTVQMETTFNGGSPSITYFGTAPDLTIPQLQSLVLHEPKTVPFGQTVVIANNRDGRQTTVSVDLEPKIDLELRHSSRAAAGTPTSNDPNRPHNNRANPSGESSRI